MHDRPWQVVGRRRESPLVLTCEHAGRRLPIDYRPSSAERRILSAHWGWDIGAWTVTRRLAELLDAPAVAGRWSRLWLDLNRRITDATLIRREAEGVVLGFNRGLSLAQVERRIDTVHVPYHEEVDRVIRARLLRGVRPTIFAIHSFTERYDGKRRGYELGVLYNAHKRPAGRLVRELKTTGMQVRRNQPYSGAQGMMYSAERHGLHHELPCLELELNQATIGKRADALAMAERIAPAIRRALL